ncbi:MAG: UpxY family transcription antiterminator, partial [Phycisphaerae bacterium]|nr:UpxY family transcription antiterminator [Phycisphaerae bacterium]
MGTEMFPAGVGADLRWVVLHTRARQEKVVAEMLGAAGVTHYLPLVPRVVYYDHRRRESQVPLFPSYVFLFGDRGATVEALKTKRVAGVLAIGDQARFAREIGQIRHAIEQGGVLEVYPHLRPGHRAVVRAGPFKGIEGLVEHEAGGGRLVLQVRALGRAAALEIETGSGERAGQTRFDQARADGTVRVAVGCVERDARAVLLERLRKL